MGGSSRALLDLETKNSPSCSIESKLTVCESNDFLRPQTTKSQFPDGKPTISSVPKSQFLRKVKDFLGVMSEANKKLQLDAKNDSEDYDIEMLTGNESEYIEMDLMLGVADLHTPEAVAAAESAIASFQPVIPLVGSSSETESEGSSDTSEDDDDDDDEDDDDNKDDDDENNGTCSPTKSKRPKPDDKDSFSETLGKRLSKKRPKIVELL